MPIQEIKDLLDKIIVFEVDFKETTLAKAKNLDESKLVELKNILIEVDSWQRKVLEKIAKEDQSFVAKLADSRKKSEQEVMNLYKQKLEQDDRKKIDIILNKIHSV